MKTRKRRKSFGSTTTIEGCGVSQPFPEKKSIRNPSVQHAPVGSLPNALFFAAPQHGEDKIWGRDRDPSSAATSLNFLVDLICKTDEFHDALQLVPFGYGSWLCHQSDQEKVRAYGKSSPFSAWLRSTLQLRCRRGHCAWGTRRKWMRILNSAIANHDMSLGQYAGTSGTRVFSNGRSNLKRALLARASGTTMTGTQMTRGKSKGKFRRLQRFVLELGEICQSTKLG